MTRCDKEAILSVLKSFGHPFFDIRIISPDALRTNPMGEIDFGMFDDIRLNLFPIALVIPDSLAVRADGK